MNLTESIVLVAVILVVLFLLFFVFRRLIKGCLIRAIITLAVLGALAFFAYRYFVN
jgi:Cu/Ag efflux pump CusA